MPAPAIEMDRHWLHLAAMRGRLAVVSLLIFACAAAVAGPAHAAGSPGVIRAQSFATAPADQTIVIRPQDDSDDNLELGRVIARTMEVKGAKPVTSGGRLLLTFATAIVPADEGGAGNTLGDTAAGETAGRVVQSDQAQINSPEPPVPPSLGKQILDSEIRINVWSTSRDSLLQGRQPGSERASTPRYILSAILFDAETGQQLWRGESVLDGASVNDLATFKQMVRPLLGYYGHNARDEQFWVD
jgi:hypothetical protein